jgi:histidinol-phosphate aminotransferase
MGINPMKIPHARLDANENPYGPSPKAIVAAVEAIRDVSRYPPSSRGLEEKIARSLGVEPDGVISAAGGDRIIELTLRCLSRSAARLLVPVPSFQMYEALSGALGLDAIFLPVPIGGYDGLLEGVHRGDLVVLGSPNNPDGKVLDGGALEELLGVCSWVIVDEAYAEYARASFANLTAQFPNLILLRTFSKAFGLASLRVGYLVAAGDAARKIRPLAGPYELSSMGIEACKACLDDSSYYERIIELTCVNRNELQKDLEGIDGIKAYPSHGNFLLFQLRGKRAAEVCEALRGRNVFVRNCSNWKGLAGEHLRVSIGTKSELQLFLSSLREVLGA